MLTLKRFLSTNLVLKAAWLYVLGVLAWAVTYFLAGDRILYFEFINALAVYFFIPLPLMFIFAWRLRRWRLGLANILLLGTFLVLWGPLFAPNNMPAANGVPTLRVMTYNLQGNAGDVQDNIAAILTEKPDVVLLQEVTPFVADALRESLSQIYPWQNLDPRIYANGMGVLSKLPFDVLQFEWVDRWNGWPQVVQVSVGGDRITLINVHLHASRPTLPSLVERAASNREHNAATLIEVIAQVSLEGPVILAGDFNVTHLSTVYKTITSELDDAWLGAGFGFGHTFPVDAEPPGLLAWKYGVPMPQGVVRIDYIFHSSGLMPHEAYRAVNLGGSDHRALVAVFEIAEN